MKKQFNFMSLLMLCIISLSACNANKGKIEESKQVDYAAIVKKELPSIDEFLYLVDGFQRDTKKLLPEGKVWDNNEKEIRKILDEKGFTTVRNEDMGFFIYATKNSKFNIKEDDYVYSFSMTPEKADSLSAAYYFMPMGDMYVKGEILLSDTCIYDALVDQIKAASYNEVTDHVDEWGNATTEKKFAKDNPQTDNDYYYFRCSREEKRITLELDFMKAQEISM